MQETLRITELKTYL